MRARFAFPLCLVVASCNAVLGIEDRSLVPADSVAQGGSGGSGGSGGTTSASNGGGAGTPTSTGGATSAGGVAGASASSGAAGAGGEVGGGSGSGGDSGCVRGGSCSATATCDAVEPSGCALTCSCVEDNWSCSSSCCEKAAKGGAACSNAAAICNNVCGHRCACDGATWACDGGLCADCPSPEDAPKSGDECLSDLGTSCSYVVDPGVHSCQCVTSATLGSEWQCVDGAGGSGQAGSGGSAGGGASSPCVKNGVCSPPDLTCQTEDGGCSLTCNCAEGTWSCSSSCCDDVPVAGRSCAFEGASCSNVCGAACTCQSGAWSCNKPCRDCPVELPLPASGEPCLLDEGSVCSVMTPSGPSTCTCAASDGATNIWSCP